MNVFKETHGQYVVSNTFIEATSKGGLEFFFQIAKQFFTESRKTTPPTYQIFIIFSFSAKWPVPFSNQTGSLIFDPVPAPASL